MERQAFKMGARIAIGLRKSLQRSISPEGSGKAFTWAVRLRTAGPFKPAA
ncbi:hypothetical protein GCM10009077_19630 [Roseibium denhamense]